MSTLVQALPADARSLAGIRVPAREARAPSRPAPQVKDQNLARLLAAVLTTSAALHFLIIGYVGRGLPAELPRARSLPPAPPPVHVIENVQLVVPPSPPPTAPKETLPDTAPTPANLPDIAALPAIAAVPATVKVNFSILATGPQKIVNTIGEASEGREAAIPDEPTLVDSSGTGGQLLTPYLPYPPDAQIHHHTGTVWVEFRTNSIGDVISASLLASSGHLSLDRNALEKTRRARWTGKAGYFKKLYEYSLH